MHHKKILNRIICTFVFLVGCSEMSFAQGKENVSVSCAKYRRGYLEFCVRNNSDRLIKFSFNDIVEKHGKNILRYYESSHDTLILELQPEKKLDQIVHFSEPVNYRIDGELYNQRAIGGKSELKLFIPIKKKIFQALNYFKVVLPDDKAIVGRL